MRIALLPGDGIGPEVTGAALPVLERVAAAYRVGLEYETFAFGGAAIDAHGEPFPADTRAAVLSADAILLGAVGGPKWNGLPQSQRPEAGLLALRTACGAYANLRPAAVIPGLEHRSALRPDLAAESDVLIVRECGGGIYYGEPRGRDGGFAWNTMRYSRGEVERVARVAFEAARSRKCRLLHVDKANVLECSAFFRDIVDSTARAYPDVELTHAYVDSAALTLVTRPKTLDVILTENLFGDILSDVAAALPGSIGVLPSATIGEGPPIFEPVHGSAPDAAGKNVANPAGAILSCALLLEITAGHHAAAQALRAATAAALRRTPTPDLGGTASTSELADEILTLAEAAAPVQFPEARR